VTRLQGAIALCVIAAGGAGFTHWETSLIPVRISHEVDRLERAVDRIVDGAVTQHQEQHITIPGDAELRDSRVRARIAEWENR